MTNEIGPGDEIAVQIIQMNEDGDGLAAYENITIFVENALPGELVQAKIKRISGNIIYAEKVRKLKEDEFYEQVNQGKK